MLTAFNIKLANIDGKKLASLKPYPTHEDLMGCIVNFDEVIKVIRIPSLMYKGPNGNIIINKIIIICIIKGQIFAATKIQSLFKMNAARKDYFRLKILVEKVKVIQRYFRVVLSYKHTKSIIK